jgi:Flp pilus assembly protein TadG
VVLFGIVELGRAAYDYSTLANAARQGARVAAVNQVVTSNTSCAEDMPVEDPSNPHWSIKACVAASAVSLGVQPSAVTVSYSPPPRTTLSCSPTLDVGCIANVSVAYTWTPSTPVIGSLIGPITLTATSQIPIERVFP